MTTSSSAASRVQANVQDLFKSKLAPGDTYIRFKLTSDITVLLSMEQVQGSLIVEAEQITPLPAMPETIMGIMGYSDRVFCVFDLAQLLSLDSPLMTSRQYQILVLEGVTEPSIQIGLAVSNFQGIVRVLSQQLKPASTKFPTQLTSYFSGVMEEGEQEIPILKLESIWNTLAALEQSQV